MCRRVRVEEIADKSLYFPGTTLERGKSLNGKYTRGPFTLHSHSQSSAQSHFYPISINFSIAAKYEESQNHCTVIIVIMPPPHFYRKYAPPFSEGSFLKILWLEMPG